MAHGSSRARAGRCSCSAAGRAGSLSTCRRWPPASRRDGAGRAAAFPRPATRPAGTIASGAWSSWPGRRPRPRPCPGRSRPSWRRRSRGIGDARAVERRRSVGGGAGGGGSGISGGGGGGGGGGGAVDGGARRPCRRRRCRRRRRWRRPAVPRRPRPGSGPSEATGTGSAEGSSASASFSSASGRCRCARAGVAEPVEEAEVRVAVVLVGAPRQAATRGPGDLAPRQPHRLVQRGGAGGGS